jgi:ABC-2 type transport system ATP-binding protein
MADVEALCKRVIVIHHGKILFDGSLSGLIERFAAYKTIIVVPEDPAVDLSMYGEVVERDSTRITLRVPKSETSRVTSRLLANLPVVDLTIAETPIDAIIEQVFAQEAV